MTAPRKSYSRRIPINQSSLWADRKPLLTHLNLELTERCNNRCIHCYINQPADSAVWKEQEMSADWYRERMEEAVRLGCLSVRLTGGEPLLRDDFEEVYTVARSLGLRVSVFTNATLITERLAELFHRIPPLEKVVVTMYGMHRGSYEAVSQTPGSYMAAREGIRLLQQYKIPMTLKMAVLPPNRKELEQFERWAFQVTGDEMEPEKVLLLDLRARRDTEERNKQIRSLRISVAEYVGILNRKEAAYRKEILEFCKQFTGVAGERLFSCGAGTDSVSVDAYGRFQLCMLLRAPQTVCHLKSISLKNAIEKFASRVRRAQAVHSGYKQRCARCFLKGLCEQCPAKSWMENGRLDAPVEYLCEIAHGQAVDLGFLRKGEKAWLVRNGEERIRAV